VKERTKNTLTLALGIALLPPIWAVLSPYIGVATGAVALICAGIYVANGNKLEDAMKITIGFLCGDIWSVLALKIMKILEWNQNLELFFTLFILGGMAVLIAKPMRKYVFLPAWLCGWAIGLTILTPIGLEKMGSMPIQVGISMIVGVWYVGVGVDKFQRFVLKLFA